MTKQAYDYYAKRTAQLGEAVPWVLDGEPHELFVAGADTSVEEVVGQFCRDVQPVEDFVVAGVPHTYRVLGTPMTAAGWKYIQTFVGRSRRYLSLETYAERHVGPLASHARIEGVYSMTVEALTRDDISSRVLREVVNDRLWYTDPAYEYSQALFLTRVVGEAGLLAAEVTLLQGVYDEPDYKSREYLTPRYGGVMLPAEAD